MKTHLRVNKNGKLFTSTLFASLIMAGSLSAHALLPSPEPALNNNVASGTNTATDTTKPISTKTAAVLVTTNASGKTELKPITASTRVKRGDVVEYHSYFTNNSPNRMRTMTVTMSVPEEVKLIGEVTPSDAYASVDGNNYSRMPLRGKVNGQVQDVPLEYYTNLRWVVEGVEINDTVVVKYRAVVR